MTIAFVSPSTNAVRILLTIPTSGAKIFRGVTLVFWRFRKWRTLHPMECCVVNIDLKWEKNIEEKMTNFELQQKVIWSNNIFSFFLQCFSSHSFFSYIYSCTGTFFWLGTNHLLETFFLDWTVFQPNIIELPSSQEKRIKIYAKVIGSIGNSTFS